MPNQTRVLPFPPDTATQLRMAEAKLAQSELIRHELAHALRTVAPTHPVLASLAPFLPGAGG